MSLPGEKLLIAATLNPVKQGQAFDELPPHMSVNRWFSMPENRRFRVLNAMDRLFTDKPVFSHAIGGRHAVLRDALDPIPVRLVKRIDMIKVRPDEEGNERFVNPEWFALHALIASLGAFDEDDQHNHVFTPHVTDTEAYQLKYRQRAAFTSVAVFATEEDDQPHRVLASFELGRK